MDIFERLENLKSHYNDKKAQESILLQQLADKEELKRKKVDSNEDLLTLKKLLDDSSIEARNQGKEVLSEIATLAVQSVFGENTFVDVVINSKDGIPTADVVVLNKYEHGVVEVDPANNDGGGLADIVALAIFFAFREINGKDNFAPYVLDEPSKFVSKGELSEKFSQFIKTMVPYSKQQYIIATHDVPLIEVGDTVYRMVKDENTGISHVTKETI